MSWKAIGCALLAAAGAAAIMLALHTSDVEPALPVTRALESPPPLIGASVVEAAERKDVAMEASPASVPAAPAIDEDFEWDRLRRHVPAGKLEVRVLRGRAPVAAVPVRLYPRSAWSATGLEPAAAVVHEQRTDGEGYAGFAGADTEEWVVRADDQGQQVLVTTESMHPAQRSRTVLLVFDDGRIDGRACSANGMPLAGQVVAVSGLGPQPARCAFATTDADGRFAVAGLCEGRYHVQLRRQPWDPHDEHMVTLAPHGSATVSFGAAAPMAHWLGALLDAAGEVIPGQRVLFLRERDSRDECGLVIDAAGRFAVDVPRGNYDVLQSEGPWSRELLGSLSLATGPTQQDLRWPWPRVVAVLVPEGQEQLDARSAAEALWLLGPENKRLKAEGPFTDARGTFVQWFPPTAGEYWIHGGRSTAITATRSPVDGMVPVQVTAAAPVVRVVLYVRQ